jgi:hypothetical protein
VSNACLQRLITAIPWISCHIYPWLADGVSPQDQQALNALLLTDSINSDLAITISTTPWFADGVNYSDYHDHEVLAITYLQQIAQKHISFIDGLLSYWWINDDITENEVSAINQLNMLADYDLPATAALMRARWLEDGISDSESRALGLLKLVFQFRPQLAKHLLDSVISAPNWSSGARAFTDLYDLVLENEEDKTSDRLHRVVTSPWFSDGLDVREQALMNAIGLVHPDDDELFNRLVSNNYSRLLSFSLPLSGPFNVWMFDDESIPENPRILNTIAHGLRGAERITQEPLPFNDIVVLMIDGVLFLKDGKPVPQYETGVSVLYHDNVQREDGRIRLLSGKTDNLYQMVARFYFTDRAGPNYPYYEFPDPRWRLFNPKWFAYSAPEFINALTNAWHGSRTLTDASNAWETEARSECASAGLTNIQVLSMQTEPPLATAGERLRHCADLYGRVLLYRLYSTLGEGRMSSVMREVYLLSATLDRPLNPEGIVIPSERDIYRTFLKHAGPDLRDEVRHWYHHIHGGPFVHEVNWA